MYQIKQPVSLTIQTLDVEMYQAFADAMKNGKPSNIAGKEMVVVSTQTDGREVKAQLTEFTRVVKPWTGSGRPPVGTTCRYSPDGDGHLERCIVVAHIKERVAFTCPDDSDSERVYIESRPGQHKFTPIRTPAQLADEEREKAIDGIVYDYTYTVGPCTHKLARSQAERIYDAGYRKVEVKP